MEPHPKPTLLERIGAILMREPEDRDQLLELLQSSYERNLMDADALAMIEGVLQVSELQARDIMVPRAQMDVVDINDTPEVFLPKVIESGHSRFPVIGESKDDVIGILLAKDLLRYYAGHESNVRDMLRPAVFIPESKRLNVLLKDFRRARNHMAIVVDEYGGVAGLVTIEDVLEQIVGDIDDEHDVDEDVNIRKDSERQYIVRGQMPIDEFNEYFQTELSDDEFDTVAGLVMKQLGRLPRRDETLQLADYEIKVLRFDRRRIDSLRLTAPRDIVPPEDRPLEKE